MSSNRMGSFKNRCKTEDKMRSRRYEVTVQLRKNKRENDFIKRRHISNSSDDQGEKNGSGCETPIKNGWSLSMDPTSLKNVLADKTKPEQQLAALQEIRNTLSAEKYSPIEEYIDAGIVPSLVACLLSDNDELLQFEAAWSLTNIAAGTDSQTLAVVNAGAVPLLVNRLASTSMKVSMQAAWCLGNIIGDSGELREYVIKSGALQPLLALVQPDVHYKFLIDLVWVLVNLSRNLDPPLTLQVVEELLCKLDMLIQHFDSDICAHALWGIFYLCHGGNSQKQLVIDKGFLPKLKLMLNNNSQRIVTVTLIVIGSIAKGSIGQKQAVLNCNLLAQMPHHLSQTNWKLRREALRVISNIADGNQSQMQAIIDNNILPGIVDSLHCGNSPSQAEAVVAVANFTSTANRAQVFALIQAGVVAPLCTLLKSQDSFVIINVLQGLFNMFITVDNQSRELVNQIKECDGIAKIEPLVIHENEDIYTMSYEIIKTYFPDRGSSLLHSTPQ